MGPRVRIRGPPRRLRPSRGDVDLARGTLIIQRSHVDGDIGKPKTRGSRRMIALPPEVLDGLRAWFAWQDEINYVLKRCVKAAGIDRRVTSHALRRTSNSPVRQTSGDVVARMITGHTTVAMTEQYSLVDAEERNEAMRKAFGAALGGTGTTSTSDQTKTPQA